MDVIYQNNAFFGREDGTYSIWDHPNFFTDHNKPKYYKPLFKLGNVLEDYYAWSDDRKETYLTILVVVAQAICCTEEQVRRYLEIKGVSRSMSGEAMLYLRKNGYLERYRVGIKDTSEDYDDEDESQYAFVQVPAPLHVGMAGTILLQYLDSKMALMKVEAWIGHNRNSMIQRYVAMNDIRLRFVELGIARNWKWHPYFRVSGDKMQLKKPFALVEIGKKETNADNRAWLIFERTQASQNFIGYIKDRLTRLEALYTTYGTLPISNTKDDGEKVLVISCATLAIANEIQETLGLQRYSFTIWVMIDEWFDQKEQSESILAAIAAPVLNEDGNSYSLARLQISL